MKKSLLSMLLFLAPLLVVGQTTDADLKTESDFRKLTFTVTTNKERYLPFEPIFVKFKLENSTDEPLEAERPSFLHDSEVRLVNPRGEIEEFSGLTVTTKGGFNLPGPVGKPAWRPGQYYADELVPAFRSDQMLIPGVYKILFRIDHLESNEVEFEIASPEGANKAAFDFLNENGRDLWFGTLLQTPDSISKLKTFVQLFSDTDYGIYGIYVLGVHYLLSQKDLEKASSEFEKLSGSSNLSLSRLVTIRVKEIASRRVESAKSRDLPKNE